MSLNHLKKILTSKNITIRDIKTEALLTLSHNYLSQYFESIEKNQFKTILDDEESIKEQIILEKEFHEIFIYLEQRIITYEKLKQLINKTNKNSINYHKVLELEPLIFFYNFLTNQVNSKLMLSYEDKNKIKWKPELLTFYLLQDYKEKYPFCFKKFDFLDSFDFEMISKIIMNQHNKLKEKYQIKGFDKEKILISTKMQNISIKTINSFTKKKYPMKIK